MRYNKEEKDPVRDVSAGYGGRSLTGFFLSGEGKDGSRDVATIYEKGAKKSDGLFCVWYNF
nr:hypothetical protein [uncultured Faecalimonas sp.]